LRLGCVASKLLQVLRQRQSRPPPRQRRIFKSYWVPLARECHQTQISSSAYPIFRVVLLTWDALSRAADCNATGQPLQPIQDFGNIKILLTVLRLLLKGFEVALIDFSYGMIRLTPAISLMTTSRPTSNGNVFDRLRASTVVPNSL